MLVQAMSASLTTLYLQNWLCCFNTKWRQKSVQVIVSQRLIGSRPTMQSPPMLIESGAPRMKLEWSQGFYEMKRTTRLNGIWYANE